MDWYLLVFVGAAFVIFFSGMGGEKEDVLTGLLFLVGVALLTLGVVMAVEYGKGAPASFRKIEENTLYTVISRHGDHLLIERVGDSKVFLVNKPHDYEVPDRFIRGENGKMVKQ